MSTIRCPLHDTASINQKEPGCIDRNRVYFYPNLEASAVEVYDKLTEAGVGPGDVVAAVADNQWRWVALLFGCLRRQAILAPVSTRLPELGLERIDKDLQPKIWIGDRERCSLAFEDLCGGSSLHVGDATPLYSMEQPATLLQTSGSTSEGKWMLHTIVAHYFSALGANQHTHLGSSDRWVLSLPVYHAGGMGILMRCVLSGASIAIPDPDEDLGEELMLYNATHVSLVPAQLRKLLQHPDAVEIARKLKVVLLGGAPCPQDLLQAAWDKGFPVYKTYGMTETLGQVTTVPGFPSESVRGNSGTVLPYRELQISGDGEIQVRGDVITEGQYQAGQVTPITGEGGWLATGDLGSYSEETGLVVQGRIDNQFTSGGENIVPEEIESVLLRLVDCEEAVVVDAPSEEFGRQPVAFLSLPEKEIATDSLIEALRRELPGYKVPRIFLTLPEQAGLKVDRNALRDLAAKAVAP